MMQEQHTSTEPDVRWHQGHLTTSDELKLFSQSWIPHDPVGTIVLVHGLAEHSTRYKETAEFFSANRWAVFTADLRGHGLSADKRHASRVHVKAFSDYSRDVDALITDCLQTVKDKPLFLLGHSMGGLITLGYVLDFPEKLTGAVVSSPALGTHPDFEPPRLLKYLVKLLSRIAPRMSFKSDLDTSSVSRDPLVVKAYEDDPLITKKVTARWYDSMMKAMKTVNDNAALLRLPLLLMQSGADKLIDPMAAGRWAETAPAEHVELVVWEGLYHEMLNEPERAQVRSRILDWLNGQIENRPS